MENSDFKLLGYRISKIEFEVDNSFGNKQEQINPSVHVENKFDSNNKRFVEVILNISVKTESESLKFFLTMKGGFQANNDMDDETFNTLAKQNGPAILYPFARGIITSYTAQANIPPIILPIVNFARSKETT